MTIINKQKKKVIKKKINKKNIINKRPSRKGGSSTEKMKNKLKKLVDEQKLIEKELKEKKNNSKSSDKSSIKKLKDRLDELINELKLLRKEVHNPENYETVGLLKKIEDDGKSHRHRRSYSVERTPSNRRPSPRGGGNIDNLHKIDTTYEPTEECTKLLKQYEIDTIDSTAEGIYNLRIGGKKKYKKKKGGNYIEQYLKKLD